MPTTVVDMPSELHRTRTKKKSTVTFFFPTKDEVEDASDSKSHGKINKKVTDQKFFFLANRVTTRKCT